MDAALDLSTAILSIFRDEGARANRQTARLMWLVEKYGVAKFRAKARTAISLLSVRI